MKTKFKAIIILCLFLNMGLVFAETKEQVRLNKIENEVWGFSYDKESDSKRLERLEKEIFGTTNPKLSEDKRIEKLTKSLGLETVEEEESSLADLYAPEKEGQGVEYPQIDELEGVLLGSVYKNDNIYTRLERLEQKVFGEKQKGDLDKRTEAIKRHAKLADGANSGKSGYQTHSYLDEDYRVNPYSYGDSSDVKLQLSAMENMVFATDFSQEPIPIRLNRLENKIFQRNFEDEDNQTRIARLQAAASANRTAKYYDNNKFQKFAATGLQAASFLLMILAFIL